MWRIWLWITTAYDIPFLLNRSSVEYRFPFRILRVLSQNHLALLKDRPLKEMRFKKSKTRRLFFSQNYRLK